MHDVCSCLCRCKSPALLNLASRIVRERHMIHENIFTSCLWNCKLFNSSDYKNTLAKQVFLSSMSEFMIGNNFTFVSKFFMNIKKRRYLIHMCLRERQYIFVLSPFLFILQRPACIFIFFQINSFIAQLIWSSNKTYVSVFHLIFVEIIISFTHRNFDALKVEIYYRVTTIVAQYMAYIFSTCIWRERNTDLSMSVEWKRGS